MQAFIRLFGRSPFTPLKTHMAKVGLCVKEILPLFSALKEKNYSQVEALAKKISKLEHEADLTKNDIRNNLPTGLFLPVARSSLLEILSLQDNLADCAENIAVLLTLRSIVVEELFREEFHVFLLKNVETFDSVYRIIDELDELLESSFGGLEAERVREIVEEVAYKEHEADLLQRELLKKMFNGLCDTMAPPHFFLWMQIIHEVASLSNESERLANRIRMMLELK